MGFLATDWWMGGEMILRALLGQKLKDDDVLEVLDDYQIENVIYDFDRLHENMTDRYWAPANSAGFQLGFDQAQILNVIFCYVVADEGFSEIDPNIIGVPLYKTFDDAEAACRQLGASYSVSGLSHPRWWLRVQADELWTHYQFQDEKLFRVTLSLPE